MPQGFGNRFANVRGAGFFQNFGVSEISGKWSPDT